MGKPTGFLEFNRKANTEVAPRERVKTFKEFKKPLDDKTRRDQAARCMNCGVPMCQTAIKLSGMVTGCPLHNLIPEWNDQIYLGHFEHAYSRLHKTSNFPEFTGRVCPALCEKACINGEYGEPVTVHDNELFTIETAWANGYIKPNIPKVRSGKKVAVIGAGPAGLAVADELNHRGHSVTVYEREDRIGGLLMYGIPNMKLDKKVILRRQALMEQEGVTFVTGADIGSAAYPADQIMKEYDAVVLCTGAKNPRPLAGADPAQVGGVYYAVDFLKATTRTLLDRGMGADGQWDKETYAEDPRAVSVLSSKAFADAAKAGTYISAHGKHVVVVGGGDTGNDCIGTVIRHGCKSVTALEMMPEPPVERTEANPWPEWPKVKKTDYGHEEAIEVFGHDPRVYETTVKEVHTDKKGQIKEIVTVKVAFGPDRKMTYVEGSEQTLPCDLLLIAAGFIGCEPYTANAFGVTLSGRGTVETPAASTDGKPAASDPERYKTAVDKVFTAGDMHRGQSLVVWAITEGRRCAHDVDLYLMGYSNLRTS